MPNYPMSNTKSYLLSWLLAGLLAPSVLAQPAQQQEKPVSQTTDPSAVSPSGGRPSIANTVPSGRQALMLRRIWGIDDVHVRCTASGEMVRFSYRVLDTDKAKTLNDKKNEPSMIVLKTGSKLEVPETEKLGKLRQTSDAENGREYWMVFRNLRKVVEPGDRVDIVIGSFRANDLIVEPPGPPARAQNP